MTRTNAVCVIGACWAVCMTKTSAVCVIRQVVHGKNQCSLRDQSLLGSVLYIYDTNAVCVLRQVCVIRACWAMCMTKTNAVCVIRPSLRDQSLLDSLHDKDQCSLCVRACEAVFVTKAIAACHKNLLGSVPDKSQGSLRDQFVGQCAR